MNSTDPSLNGQGEIPPKAKKPKKTKPRLTPEEITAGLNRKPAETVTNGRLGSEIAKKKVQWLLKPWFPMGMLSLIAGQPQVGKSTFIAFLVAHAGRAAILPGYEEDVGISTLSRMERNNVSLRLVRFLDDKHYSFPRDKAKVANILSRWDSRLLVIDPIDSYMDDEMSENDGKDVRTFLESICWIAQETGAAIIGVRHPGKDKTNVMPGSRSWRAVPRSIALLVNAGGTPPRYLIRHEKDSQGQDAMPCEYVLVGERGEPRAFQLKGDVDPGLNDFSIATADPSGRRKLRDACLLMMSMFDREEKPRAREYKNRCKELGIPDTSRYDAMEFLKVDSAPEEAGGEWYMFRCQKEWPKWLLDEDRQRGGGVPVNRPQKPKDSEISTPAPPENRESS